MHPNLGIHVDGFWLPKGVRKKLLTPQTEFITSSFTHGRPCEPEAKGAITARWPRLLEGHWRILLDELENNRQAAPTGQEFWDRLLEALRKVGERFSDPSDNLYIQALNYLPGYTGYSEPMIRLTVGSLGLFSLEKFPSAFTFSPTNHSKRYWQEIPGLPGRLRYYPGLRIRSRFSRRLPRISPVPSITKRALFRKTNLPEVIVGYGAGNIPGTALLISFLSQSITLAGGKVPVTIIKNSRNEPIFSPLVLGALEVVDPELFSTVAVLVWDYEDAFIQDFLINRADLVIAAASDETISEIQTQIDHYLNEQNRKSSHIVRFHPHGHKVSFSAINRQMLHKENIDEKSGQSIFDIVTLLAALDSVFWDQHGCLSSRVHFVETASDEYHSPGEYARRLVEQLRLLANIIPRGAWPLQQLHDRFDRYKHLEMAGKVQVMSQYGDEFLVILENRCLTPPVFHSQVNDCQGRVIVVQPISCFREIPSRYLRMLPPKNLQSLSVAIGSPGEGLTDSFLHFSEMCGACGITAIRTIGRAAFPQLAYSWDGFIPLDLARQRSKGYFTTIEFNFPYEQILETFQLLQDLEVVT